MAQLFGSILKVYDIDIAECCSHRGRVRVYGDEIKVLICNKAGRLWAYILECQLATFFLCCENANEGRSLMPNDTKSPQGLDESPKSTTKKKTYVPFV